MASVDTQREFRQGFEPRADEESMGMAADRIAKMLGERRGLNDEFSFGPGVTVYFRDHEPEINGTMPEQLDRIAAEAGRPQLSGALQSVEGMAPGTYRLDLPEGGFFLGLGGFEFYQEIGYDVERNDTLLLATGYPFILRIEGHHGELWQNWHYNPDGTPA